jgi:hypothetical protein
MRPHDAQTTKTTSTSPRRHATGCSTPLFPLCAPECDSQTPLTTALYNECQMIRSTALRTRT